MYGKMEWYFDDARQQGSSTRSRISHTSQGDAAAANAAGGILMVVRDDLFLDRVYIY